MEGGSERTQTHEWWHLARSVDRCGLQRPGCADQCLTATKPDAIVGPTRQAERERHAAGWISDRITEHIGRSRNGEHA
jgi:hypothetical protein